VSRPRIRDLIVPGSVRVERTVWETTVMTVRCGRCSHEQEVNAHGHTARCKRCSRVMRLDRAPVAENITPIRRRA
jgi:ribosomal protein S27E